MSTKPKTKAKAKTVTKHFLISIDLVPTPMHVHAYIMCPEWQQHDATTFAMNMMMDKIEEEGFDFMLPAFLITELSTGAEFVREIVTSINPETKKMLAEATTNHLTVWGMAKDNPIDQQLMALH